MGTMASVLGQFSLSVVVHVETRLLRSHWHEMKPAVQGRRGSKVNLRLPLCPGEQPLQIPVAVAQWSSEQSDKPPCEESQLRPRVGVWILLVGKR